MLLCSLGFISFGLITPFLSKVAIDYGLNRGDAVVFHAVLAAGAISFLFSALIGIIQKYLGFHVSVLLGLAVRMDYYERLCRQPLSFFDSHSPGELFHRLTNDTASVVGLVTGTIPNVLLTLFRLVLVGVICVMLSWQVTLFVAGGACLHYALNHYFGLRGLRITTALAEKGQRISGLWQDTLSRIVLFKAFYRERQGLNAYRREALAQSRILAESFWLTAASGGTQQALSSGFALLLSLYLGTLVISGQLTLGAFVALAMYLSQLSGLLRSLGGVYQGLISQFVYVDRFFEVYGPGEGARAQSRPGSQPGLSDFSETSSSGPARLRPRTNCRHAEEVPVVPEPLPSDVPAIAFEDVSYSYPNGHLVLEGLNLSVWPGETLLVLGNSGVGKSTFAKLLMGLLGPATGRIVIFGRALDGLSDRERRRTLGIALQDSPLLNASMRENVTFGRRSIAEEDYRQVLSICGLEGVFAGSASRADARLGDAGGTVSVGQRQRIAIAMALLKQPRILVLDEATNQVETQLEEQIVARIHRFYPKMTVIVLSCRHRSGFRSDRVLELVGLDHDRTLAPSTAAPRLASRMSAALASAAA